MRLSRALLAMMALSVIALAVPSLQLAKLVPSDEWAKDAIEKWATSCNMYYVNNRWLGGMMTNFQTIRRSVLRLLELERMVEDGTMDLYSKKEQARLNRERLSAARTSSSVSRGQYPALMEMMRWYGPEFLAI